MADSRRTIIKIYGVDIGLYPSNAIYPKDDLFPGHSDVLTLDSGIVSGTLHLNQILIDGDYSFGQVCSDMFEAELFGIPINVNDRVIEVTQVINDTTIPLFSGKVESSTQDAIDPNYRKITAYDDLYYAKDKNIADAYNAFFENSESSTLSILRDAMLTEVGITVATHGALFNDNLVIHKYDDLTVFKFGDLLRMICEVQCVVPHMNANGELTFIDLSGGTERDIRGLTEKLSSQYEEYTTDVITGIDIYDTADNLVFSHGSQTNPYSIANNIFILDMDANGMGDFCVGALSRLARFTYKPFMAKMIESNPNFKLGDLVQTDKGYSYIFSNELSGSMLVEQTLGATANGQKREAGAKSYNDSIITTKKTAQLEMTLDHFYLEFQDFERQTSAQFEVTADSIESKVAKSVESYDETGYTINYYGYGNPSSSKYPPSENNGKYYLDRESGYVWSCNGTSWVRSVSPLPTIDSQLDSKITETADSIVSTVSATYNKYEIPNSITITYYGIGAPTNAQYPPGSNNGNYYLDESNGYVYYCNGSSWSYNRTLTKTTDSLGSQISQSATEIKSTVASSTRQYDEGSYVINYYGYGSPDTAVYPPSSNSGKYYLNQTNGFLYYCNGTYWYYAASLQLITAQLSTQVTQTAQGLSAKVSKGEVLSEINMEAGTLYVGTGHITISSNNFSVDSSGNASMTGAVTAKSFDFTENNGSSAMHHTALNDGTYGLRLSNTNGASLALGSLAYITNAYGITAAVTSNGFDPISSGINLGSPTNPWYDLILSNQATMDSLIVYSNASLGSAYTIDVTDGGTTYNLKAYIKGLINGTIS